MTTHFKIPLDRADTAHTSAYDYELPEHHIAHAPASARQRARMMIVDPASARFEHAHFEDLPELLRPHDLLVFNDTRVIPGRVLAQKPTGGKVELLVLSLAGAHTDWERPSANGRISFECMTRASKALRAGTTLSALQAPELSFAIEQAQAGRALVSCVFAGSPLELLGACGRMPLPPYIVKRRKTLGQAEEQALDPERYQTTFARAPGAIAAPTAGLHFSEQLLGELEARRIERAHVTLHVGPGTFQPMHAGELSAHAMHSEPYLISDTLAAQLERARAQGGRVCAVGTTSARVLESEARRERAFEPGARDTQIFLHPGYGFQLCEGLITNFHLPHSTLLAMVAAKMGYALMRRVYDAAIDEGYMFYSYGDGMLILDGVLG